MFGYCVKLLNCGRRQEAEAETESEMFARFRNIFGKSKADEVPTIVVDEAPVEESPGAPLASEEEDLSNGLEQPLSASTQELSQLLDAINLSSQLPDLSSDDTEQDEPKDGDDDEDVDDDDETASTSSVKTKIAKASIERDIIVEDPLEEEEEEPAGPPAEQPGQNSLDKIKALIRNDSETYPHSDYTDTDEPSPLHSRTASVDSTAEQPQLSKPNLLSCDYSVVPDELPLDSSPSIPSPMHDSGRNSSTGSGESIQAETPATLTVTPTGSNDLACAAISHKLSAIAEVAESLDAVIRDCSGAELDLSTSATHKKLGMASEVSEPRGWVSVLGGSFIWLPFDACRTGSRVRRKTSPLPRPPRAISRPIRIRRPFKRPRAAPAPTLAPPRTPLTRRTTRR